MKSQSQDFLKNCKATQIEPFKDFLFFSFFSFFFG